MPSGFLTAANEVLDGRRTVEADEPRGRRGAWASVGDENVRDLAAGKELLDERVAVQDDRQVDGLCKHGLENRGVPTASPPFVDIDPGEKPAGLEKSALQLACEDVGVIGAFGIRKDEEDVSFPGAGASGKDGCADAGPGVDKAFGDKPGDRFPRNAQARSEVRGEVPETGQPVSGLVEAGDNGLSQSVGQLVGEVSPIGLRDLERRKSPISFHLEYYTKC